MKRIVQLRLHPPMVRWFMRPGIFEDDQEWPNFTMTEGIDVYEEEDKVVVKAPVPGIPAEQVDVTFEDGVLRIKAQYEESQEEKNKKKVMYRMERVAAFDYTTTLPRPVDEQSIDAKVEDGVVIVTAKIAEAAKPKRIEVKASK